MTYLTCHRSIYKQLFSYKIKKWEKLILKKYKDKIEKLNIAVSRNSNKWEDVSDQINNLRINIKNGVKEYINPLSLELK